MSWPGPPSARRTGALLRARAASLTLGVSVAGVLAAPRSAGGPSSPRVSVADVDPARLPARSAALGGNGRETLEAWDPR